MSVPSSPAKAHPSGTCPSGGLCPLSEVPTGKTVRIKQLSGTHEVTARLREMGFCEDQCIRLVSRSGHFICQVCQARVGLSSKLAAQILVEPTSPQLVA